MSVLFVVQVEITSYGSVRRWWWKVHPHHHVPTRTCTNPDARDAALQRHADYLRGNHGLSRVETTWRCRINITAQF